MSSAALEKAIGAIAAAKELIDTTEVDHSGTLPLKVDLEIARLISVAGVQANIAQAQAVEGILAQLIKRGMSCVVNNGAS